jgi:hypothetical protein
MRLNPALNPGMRAPRAAARASLLRLMLAAVAACASPGFPQPAAILEKALAQMRSVRTLRCTITRKQAYKGICKTAQCVFYHDRPAAKFAYVYSSPFEYSFWTDGSSVCGVQRGKKRGYTVTAAADSISYRSLLSSIHICEPLFHFERTDTLRVSLKASIDDFLYFECALGGGNEALKIDRNRNVVTLIEAFDRLGAVRQQTVFEYDSARGKPPWFPRRIITRGNGAGAIETDTLIFTKVEINKPLQASVFVPPPFADMRQTN